MVRSASTDTRERIIENLAVYLPKIWYSSVKAALPGYGRPDLISYREILMPEGVASHAPLTMGASPHTVSLWPFARQGHVPDVSAWKNGKLHIFRVETAESILDEHIADKWKLFSCYAHQTGAFFHVVVPEKCTAEAKLRLQNLGIKAQIWAYSE